MERTEIIRSASVVLPHGTRFAARGEDFVEIGRARVYLFPNDLHRQPAALLEDLFVDPSARRMGAATRLVEAVIEEAGQGAYKLVATSRFDRPEVHELYRKLGFRLHGYEFRMDFPANGKGTGQ